MGSSEPTLVPEWLRCNGNGTSGSSASHNFSSYNLHSDGPLLANSARNRSLRSNSEFDNPRAVLDRSSSINSRRKVTNNGSSKHPYSSFSRSHRDKEREREKEKLAFGDFWDRDTFDPLGKDSLRRTRSMTSRKQGDLVPRRVASDSRNTEKNIHLHSNGLVTDEKTSITVPNASFDKDFPSLGADEKQGAPSIVRTASPGLPAAPQGMPIGSSALVGEGWSALAEVPVVLGNNNNSSSLVHQPLATTAASVAANTVSGASNTSSKTPIPISVAPKTAGAPGPASGLNMAEALVQSSSVLRTTPQLSVETQRLEQLAIKKVRQLIPMTPTMPKVLNSSDKLKPKLIARIGEASGSTKIGPQAPPSSLHVIGQSPRGVPVTSDASKQSHGSKLFVLKPQWENGLSATSSDGSNLENGVGDQLANNQLATPSGPSSPVRDPAGSTVPTLDRKAGGFSLSMVSAVEKRPCAQSRSEFFKSVREKTLMSTSVTPESISTVQSPSGQKSCELLKEIKASSPCATENGGSNSNGDSIKDHKLTIGDKNSIPSAEVIPVEEETAFLRSLGWEENGEEDEGLTEEEIKGFFEGLQARLSQGAQPTLSILAELQANNLGGTSPKASSSDDSPNSI